MICHGVNRYLAILVFLLAIASGHSWAACNVLITTFGAVGDGTTDNTTAIQNAFNNAHTNGCSVTIPAGTFAHSGVLNATGIAVLGLGSSSILQATVANSSAIELSGTAPSLSNLVILGTGSTRTFGPQQAGVWVNAASNFTVSNILINGGSCVGIWDQGGQTGTESNDTVENTLSDSITNTNGAANITEINDLVINSGDDAFSSNSYTTDGNTVNHITVTGSTVLGGAARGLEVSGGTNITFTNNYIDDRSGFADILLASETSSFQTRPVDTVTVSGNTLVTGGPNQGALFFWPEGSGNTVSNVTANNNRWYNVPTFTAVQVTGAGTLTNDLVENSTAYISPGPSFFSSSFTGTGSITQTSNTTTTKASYPGPLNPILGGTVPIFSLPSGTYTLPQSLMLNDPTSGSAISYCTTSGSSCTPGTAYTTALTVSSSETVCADGVNSSSLTPVTSAVVCTAITQAANGTNWPIAAGAPVSTIQSTINSAAAATAGPNTVNLAAGPYSITSQITIPCPQTPLTIQGPPLPGGVGTTWPITPTAILTSTLTNNFAFRGTACGVPVTFQYLQYDGGNPSGGGGGFLYVPPGMNKLTVTGNWFYGNSAVQAASNQADTFIWFDGSSVLGSTRTQNTNITWNRFGKAGSADCANLMNVLGASTPPSVPNEQRCAQSGGLTYTFNGHNYGAAGYGGSGSALCLYQDDDTIKNVGGYCAAVGVHVNVDNFTLDHNSVNTQEQGFKFFEGCCPYPDLDVYKPTNVTITNNDFSGIHRIGVEAQMGGPGPWNISNNSMHDQILYSGASWAWSLPQNGSTPGANADNTQHLKNNLILQNINPSGTTDKSGLGAARAFAVEWWDANGNADNNLIQGFWGGGAAWGFGGPGWTISNNIFQQSTAVFDCYICNEEGGSSAPAQVGNTFTHTVSALTSTAPTISPAPGGHASPLTVTLSDPGDTSGLGPQGNTSIWYTTDGSAPVPGAGTAQLYSLPITVSLPATVKAVGMWGALNQPTSYASGYGYVPSAVQIAAYTSTGGVTLSSASIASTGGVSTLGTGGTVQMIVTCHYSDGTTSGCNTTDSHGNAVTAWASSTGNITISSTGLATGAGVGTSVITATVTGGFTTSPGVTLTITGTAFTLSSVSLATAGGVGSMNAGTTNQLLDTCHYSDGSATSCNTTDSHGNAVSTYNSSAPAIATVSSSGVVTGVAGGSTNLTGTVNPAPSILGTSLQNVGGFTNNGFINEIYGVTGTSPGSYVPGNCHIIIPATTNWTAGKVWTCLLVAGTPTTQNAAALCSNSYTMTGTSWPGGDIIISMASCPTLPPDQGYWVGSTTNQTAASPAQGFSNCNSSCSGGAPVFGSGSYPYRYVANTFGNYTSLPTTLSVSGSPGQQVSQYLELTTTPVTSGNLPLSVTTPPPSLVSAYLTASSGSMIVGSTMQMAAKCHYTSGPDQDCTVADIYGDAVSAWLTSDPSKATVNNAGASNPGLVTAVSPGTPSITATIGAGTTSSPYPITVSSPAVTLTGVSLSLTGGVTGLFVGATNQLKATCAYSDGSSDNCTTTDAHGNLAHSYLSAAPAHATVNAASGLVTGVALGATTFTAVAGSLTSNPLPLAVFPVLSGVYTITLSGSVKFSGTVRF